MTKEVIKGYSNRVTQASKSELIVIMYDMATDYLQDSILQYSTSDIIAFRQSLKKAQRVINELTGALDLNYEISIELMRLYLYMNKVMLKASIRKEIEEVQVVIKMIEKLRTAFAEVSRQDFSGPVMQNTQKVYAGLTYSNGGFNQEYQDQDIRRGFTV